MTKPLVSAVIATHNLEKYVREGLRAAFAQTYEPASAEGRGIRCASNR